MEIIHPPRKDHYWKRRQFPGACRSGSFEWMVTQGPNRASYWRIATRLERSFSPDRHPDAAKHDGIAVREPFK